MWAGACLLLAVAGCSKDDKTINETGVYSPIITGIASNYEPAARGTANLLTAQVTNVNGLPLTYHWSVEGGTLGADSTNGTVTWTPPDTIGNYDVTVSIEAQDGDQHFFKNMTIHMAVDNQYTRWTRTEQIKFDPAPVFGGGVLYAEYRNILTGTSDAYRVDTPLAGPIKLTENFFSVASPTPRADKTQFAFAGRKVSGTGSPTIYLLPFGGGDTAAAIEVTRPRPDQTILMNPRFAHSGSMLLYTSDSLTTTYPKMWKRDLSSFTAPVNLHNLETSAFQKFFSSNWGPDSTGDGVPDYVVSTYTDLFSAPLGVMTMHAGGGASDVDQRPLLNDPSMEEPDWSPDGRHVAFVRRNPAGDRDIWIVSLTAVSLDQAKRVTFGPADEHHPRFNSDGSMIFFVSNRVDRYGVTGVSGTERRGTNIWSVAHFDRP